MLLEFSFANFLSFKDKVTFSMVATSLKDKKADISDVTFSAGGEMPVVLSRTCALFGANASGKSNLIKAMSFFKWFTMNSSKEVQAGEKIPVSSFALSIASVAEPSLFEIVILIGEDTYRYGFEASAEKVHREWLYVKAGKKRSKEVELFYREENE